MGLHVTKWRDETLNGTAGLGLSHGGSRLYLAR